MADAAVRRHLPPRRREFILREIELHQSVRTSHAASSLNVAELTIRRDLAVLESEGRLVRIHGGAMSSRTSTPTLAARTLVGVVVPDATTHFERAVRGMQTAAAAQGARIVVAVSNFHSDLEERHVARLVESGMEGLIIAPSHRGRDDESLARWLADVPIPVVLLERHLESTTLLKGFDSVSTDDVRGAIDAIEHLAELGHESVGLAIYERTPTAPFIRSGFTRAVAEKGLRTGPVVSLPKGDADPGELDAILRELLDQCVRTGTRALLVHTDFHASRLVDIAMEIGIAVPEHVAIVAYDDIFAEHAVVSLTAVSSPRHELGMLALQTVLDRIGERNAQLSSHRHLSLLPQLTIRASTERSPGTDHAAVGR